MLLTADCFQLDDLPMVTPKKCLGWCSHWLLCCKCWWFDYFVSPSQNQTEKWLKRLFCSSGQQMTNLSVCSRPEQVCTGHLSVNTHRTVTQCVASRGQRSTSASSKGPCFAVAFSFHMCSRVKVSALQFGKGMRPCLCAWLLKVVRVQFVCVWAKWPVAPTLNGIDLPLWVT